MTRFPLFFALSLAACGDATQAETPAEGEVPHTDQKHDAHDGDAKHEDGDGEAPQATYACPMHPDITAHEPGECSKCGMALVEQKQHDHTRHDHEDGR